MKFLRIFFFILLITVSFLITAGQAAAADIRAGENVIIPEDEKNLQDLYLFGNSIRVEAPVSNDIVAAGGDITIHSDVTGSIIAAGGNINQKGSVGNTIRIAGGNIIIDGEITRDLVVAGGSVTVTKNAVIKRDIIAAGGTLNIEAPVQGKVLLNGGQVTINSAIAGNVDGNVGKLTLGPNAVINGNLTYSSSEKATTDPSAVVKGKTNYRFTEKPKETAKGVQGFLAIGTLYKLVTDIILTVLFIFFFARFMYGTLSRMMQTPMKSGAIGFAFFFLAPLASLMFLVLIWLGIASFFFYVLAIIVALFVVKAFIGWFIVRWYEERQGRKYLLDWKAGVFGPIALFLLLLIPIIGWLAVAIIFFIALGAFLEEIITPLSAQKLEARTQKKIIRN